MSEARKGPKELESAESAELTESAPATLVNRELSWLSFNGRVLQEAADPSVPLLERLFFCGVFSSNLDEFFKVRVASLRYLLRLGKKDARSLGFSPHRLLHDIHRMVVDQQERYGPILSELQAALRAEGIHIVDDSTVPEDHYDFLRSYFAEEVSPHLTVSFLEAEDRPFLANSAVYLVIEVWPRDQIDIKSWSPSYGLVKVPSPPLARFVALPWKGTGPRFVMFLDDVIRFNMDRLCLDREVGRAYAVKLTRDAELYLDEMFDGDLPEAIRSRLGARDTGTPSRFLYDMRSPYSLIHQMQHTLSLREEDLVLGGRSHNLSDFMDFPRFDWEELSFPDWPPIPHPHLEDSSTVLDKIRDRDQVVHTPYQSYGHVVRFIQEAAKDPEVDEIWLTVYRVARDSAILHALIEARAAGKKVVVFMEIQARFDEESNLDWAERLEAAGAEVIYPTAGLKVHAKIALVVRAEDGQRKLFAYVGTGNFNEKTARVYADHGILTSDERITNGVEQVFSLLCGHEGDEPEHLLVAPRSLRSGFYDLIEAETAAARRGDASGMILKMNALEDAEIINKLYEASRAGVPIQIIVRGICRLVPGIAGQSETIEVRSILDRYLEHARIYLFHNGGEEKLFLASADWMTRNLSKRVEVAIPVYDPEIRRQIRTLLDLQLADNVKARVIDATQSNQYVPRAGEAVRSQQAFRDFLGTL